MKALVLFCLFPLSLCLGACSIPKLESPDCSAARDVAREYYSLAIGGEPSSHPEVFEKLERMRTSTFSPGESVDASDQFYFSRIRPTSYRAGECSLSPDGRVMVETVVIWRQEGKNSERKDSVNLVKSGDSWLIERIEVGQQPGPEF
jgi:hypothetical protein